MLVSPSIISADMGNLKDQVARCDSAGSYSLHLDVMDGHFVPNLTIGFDFIKAIRKNTGMKLEAHLMIDRPDRYYRRFMEAGSDTLLIHVESPIVTGELLKSIQGDGGKFGVVVNPETPVERAFPFLENAEILLVMSVHPGFFGQKFIQESLGKLVEARKYVKDHGLKTLLEIDGGINDVTGKMAADAGADILVSGSYIFSGAIEEKIGLLKSL